MGCEEKEREGEEEMILDDEVFAVLMAVVIVACVFSIAQMIPRDVEPFVAIGTLNEEGKLGDYPRVVVAGEPVRLQVFISNHEGKASMLRVMAKLGSKGNIPTNATFLNSSPIWDYIVVLDHGENVTVPVSLTLNEEGSDVAIVFELWEFNTSSRSWVYTGRWNHLYVNVTRQGVVHG